MAGGYAIPANTPVDQLIQQLESLRDQVRELQRPDGSQLNDAVKKLEQLVNDLPGQVFAVLATAVNTGDVTATGFGHFGGEVTAGGNASVTGSLGVTGNSSFGPVKSAYSRAHTVLSGYANAYWDGNGDAGVNVSSVDSKQDIAPADLSEAVEALRTLALVQWRNIAAVDEFGDEAPTEYGSIAQYVAAKGLDAFTFNVQDPDGDTGVVQGINYERWTIPLVAAFQSIDARLRAAGI